MSIFDIYSPASIHIQSSEPWQLFRNGVFARRPHSSSDLRHESHRVPEGIVAVKLDRHVLRIQPVVTVDRSNARKGNTDLPTAMPDDQAVDIQADPTKAPRLPSEEH